MSSYITAAADLIAISVLTFGIYLPRHRRRDLVTAYLAVNVGVLAVTVALSSSTASMGLALGLFGVLSIIRLRSSELAQHEVAYYFCSLALGLLGGISGTPTGLAIALMVVLVAVTAIGDHPRLLTGYRHHTMVLDRAITDERELRSYVESLLHAQVHSISVGRTDLVHDSTVIDVRYRIGEQPSTPELAATAGPPPTAVAAH